MPWGKKFLKNVLNFLCNNWIGIWGKSILSGLIFAYIFSLILGILVDFAKLNTHKILF